MTSPSRVQIKWIVTLALLGLIAVIGLQNIQEATISMLFWTFRLPLIVIIVLSYAVGVVVGWLWWPFTARSEPDA